MSNLRIVSDNAIDRAVLTASSSASASMSTSNLKSDRKSAVWRSALGTTAWLAATWSSLEPISAVALPFCNLSPTATMRVRTTNEASTTNKLSSSNDFTQAVWTKTSATVSGAVTGPDGLLSAYTLTASAAGGTIQQSVAVSAGNNVSSIFVRRRSGTGAVSIRNAANTAWTAIGVGAGWTRFANDGGVTGTTAYLYIQLATSGDSVDIAYGQIEVGSVATSYYPGTRPLGYIDGWQSYTYDSGAVQCAPEPAVTLRGWTAAQSASAYAFGGGSFARVWIPQTSAYGLRIDIVDNSNVQGYIEAARWVVGPYWSATYNPSAVSFGIVDTTDIKRTDGGDQVTDAGTVYRTLSISLSMMAQADRAPFIALVRNSRVYPMLVSVFPEQADIGLERDTALYGRRTKNTDISIQYAYAYTSSVELESI